MIDELYQKNKQIVFSSILIRAKWIRQRRVCHFWRHSSRDQEDTRNFNYNLELLEESPSKHIYIYIHIIQASPLIYLDKVESRYEGCFSRARHRHAEECQTAFAHPFDAISELLSPPLLEILDFPRYAL